MTTYIMNMTFLISDLSHTDPINLRPLGSVTVLLMWLKLLYFLRLFLPTLYMIRMIIEVFYDMYTFVVVMVLAMLAFGNALYILAKNAIIVEGIGMDENE